MKTLLYISFFILIYFFSLTQENELYYWEGKIKHNFKVDSSVSLIEVRQDRLELESLQSLFPDLESIRIKDDSTVQLITKNKAALLSALDTKSLIYEYPSILSERGGISFITDEISVRFSEEPQKDELESFERKYKISHLLKTSYGAHIFISPIPNNSLEIANSIQESGDVVWSKPNFVHLISLHNDPLYPDQFYLNNTGQGGGTTNIDINAPEAWGITLGCGNIRIAVIDDGVDNHEDFDGRVLPGFTAGFNNTGGAPTSKPLLQRSWCSMCGNNCSFT